MHTMQFTMALNPNFTVVRHSIKDLSEAAGVLDWKELKGLMVGAQGWTSLAACDWSCSQGWGCQLCLVHLKG